MPEINVLPCIQPFYIGRAVGGGMVFTSAIVQAYNIYMTRDLDTSQRIAPDGVQDYIAGGRADAGRRAKAMSTRDQGAHSSVFPPTRRRRRATPPRGRSAGS